MSLINDIEGVWRFVRTPHFLSSCHSTHGHLIHFLESGEYVLRANKREYEVKAGDVIYYHGSERVEWVGGDSEVTFISIAFSSASFPPFSPEHRVFNGCESERELFVGAYENSLEPSSLKRRLKSFALCAEILSHMEEFRNASSCGVDRRHPLDSNDLWWGLERDVLRSRNFRISIDELCALANCSRSTLSRRCEEATGVPPTVRLREIRMSEAMALLSNSGLNVSQIADYLRYPRMHEFSREFKKHFGNPPTRYRNRGNSPMSDI